MKIIFFLIVFVSIIFISGDARSQYEYEDSAKVSLEPDYIHNECVDEKINLIIENISSDTLLIINDFILIGLNRNILVYPMTDYSPNIIMFREIDKNYMQGDGYYSIDYRAFPEIVVISPKEKVIIEIYLNSVKEIVENKSWDLSSYIRLARKKSMDSIIDNYYPEVKPEYLNSLVYNKKVQSDGNYSIRNPEADSSDSIYYKIIEREFYLLYP